LDKLKHRTWSNAGQWVPKQFPATWWITTRYRRGFGSQYVINLYRRHQLHAWKNALAGNLIKKTTGGLIPSVDTFDIFDREIEVTKEMLYHFTDKVQVCAFRV
jgi:hypothetical protein